MEVIFSDHAVFEMKRRQVDEKMIKGVFKSPHQQISSKKGRIIIQGKYLNHHQQKEMLLRIIGRKKGDTFYVTTVYKTSKIEKYWIEEA